MAEWVPIQDGRLIAADVIRWKEGVYGPRRSRKRKSARLGDRLVTAEVLKEPDLQGWTEMLVLKCETLKVLSTKKPPELSCNIRIKRALKTIMRGIPERMLWSDESARDSVVGKLPGVTSSNESEYGK